MGAEKLGLTAEALKTAFENRFGKKPRLFRAPGRVNLIGEHTDYNGGFVMPAAIDMATWTAVSPGEGRRVRMASITYGEAIEFDLDQPPARPAGKCWVDYVWGVAMTLERAGLELAGADMMIDSEVPIGSGLSSSAAAELSVASALVHNSGLRVEPLELARLCQRAEHEYAGTRCGLMDQFASTFGRLDSAMLLDCRSLEWRALPLPAEVCLIVANTMVKHELASGEYNLRRADCEQAAQRLGLQALRDASLAQLGSLPDPMQRRARHVVTENARTQRAAEALLSGNLTEFGALMNESHASLRDDFEVSCRELDTMAAIARRQPGVYGSRMMGGGFGGCTVTLAAADRAEAIMTALADSYRQATGINPSLYRCRAVDGASEYDVR